LLVRCRGIGGAGVRRRARLASRMAAGERAKARESAQSGSCSGAAEGGRHWRLLARKLPRTTAWLTEKRFEVSCAAGLALVSADGVEATFRAAERVAARPRRRGACCRAAAGAFCSPGRSRHLRPQRYWISTSLRRVRPLA